MRMISSIVLMVISSRFFVELCQFRILPLTARFASFTLAFDLALCSSLSPKPFVARWVAPALATSPGPS
jgi:hypothetical protein